MQPDEMGAAQQRLNDYMRRVGDIQQRAEETQARIKQMRAQATSTDRTVSVVLAPGGRLEKLTLTPQALQHGHERLAALITDTIQRGHQAAAEQMQAALQPLVGGTSAMEFLSEHISAAQQDDPAQQQPQPPNQQPPDQQQPPRPYQQPAPPPAPRRRPSEPDDDEPFGSFLR